MNDFLKTFSNIQNTFLTNRQECILEFFIFFMNAVILGVQDNTLFDYLKIKTETTFICSMFEGRQGIRKDETCPLIIDIIDENFTKKQNIINGVNN